MVTSQAPGTSTELLPSRPVTMGLVRKVSTDAGGATWYELCVPTVCGEAGQPHEITQLHPLRDAQPVCTRSGQHDQQTASAGCIASVVCMPHESVTTYDQLAR